MDLNTDHINLLLILDFLSSLYENDGFLSGSYNSF